MNKILPFIAVSVFGIGCAKQPTSIATGKVIHTNTTLHAAVASTTYQLQFAGYTWNIKDYGTTKVGPGPNLWTRNNVWVDANGYLHLKVAKNAINKWQCAEVSSVQTFGNGTFQWKLDGNVSAFNKNIVFGLFQYSGTDGIDELDIEFARWGNSNNLPLNYTVYPSSLSLPTFHTTKAMNLTAGNFSTHRYIKTATSMTFKSMYGHYNDDTNLFSTATCSAPSQSITAVPMPVYMNLWCFQGLVPSDKNSAEVIVRDFTFVP